MTDKALKQAAIDGAEWLLSRGLLKWNRTAERTFLRLDDYALSADLNSRVAPLLAKVNDDWSYLGQAIYHHKSLPKSLQGSDNLAQAVIEIEGELSHWRNLMGGDKLSPPLHEGSI